MTDIPRVGFLCAGNGERALAASVLCAKTTGSLLRRHGYAAGGHYTAMVDGGADQERIRERLLQLCLYNNLLLTFGCDGFSPCDIIPELTASICERGASFFAFHLCGAASIPLCAGDGGRGEPMPAPLCGNDEEQLDLGAFLPYTRGAARGTPADRNVCESAAKATAPVRPRENPKNPGRLSRLFKQATKENPKRKRRFLSLGRSTLSACASPAAGGDTDRNGCESAAEATAPVRPRENPKSPGRLSRLFKSATKENSKRKRRFLSLGRVTLSACASPAQAKHTDFARNERRLPSRGTAGICGNCLILNLPNDGYAAKARLTELLPMLNYAIIGISGRSADLAASMERTLLTARPQWAEQENALRINDFVT